ncbi:hypothetical protein GCM10008943_05160 [Paenochrobactrum glaciei]
MITPVLSGFTLMQPRHLLLIASVFAVSVSAVSATAVLANAPTQTAQAVKITPHAAQH